MKILYVATIGGFMPFFKSIIRTLLNDGNVVDIACGKETASVPEYYSEWGCKIFSLSCSRNPLKKDNIKAVSELREIVSNGKYDIVHCHTPVAGAITRLACRKLRKSGLKVIYTAHGFHFYKGAPLKNWLIYYPIEKFCSCFTDVLITINREDYEFAKKKMKAKRVEYVPGVGIDVDRFANTVVDRAAKRRELGIPEDAFLLFSVGELNENKNHQIVIRALAELKNPDVHYMIAGKGPLKDYLLALAEKLGVKEQVHLLGYRDDVAELYKTADTYVLPSKREGLNVSLLEAMSSGLPCIVSNIRGNVDLICDRKNGFLCSTTSVEEFSKSIMCATKAPNRYELLAQESVMRVFEYDISDINKRMRMIYES